MIPIDPPDTTVTARQVFKLDFDLEIPAFRQPGDYTPQKNPDFVFDPMTTLAILAGVVHNRRVLIQGLHGTGKSSHIEQVAAYLNWPCLCVNLDSQISRFDLIGKDVITLSDGYQKTEFREGILPFAMQNPMMLIFNEYDAGRPDVMFVLQRVLEDNGTLTLLDQTRVIHPNKWFRIFATANTIGLGDETGLYYGTQQLNQAQLDRWHIVSQLSYLTAQHEFAMIRPKVTDVISDQLLKSMIETANRIRSAFAAQKITNVISPRAVISWAENTEIMKSVPYAFRVSFLNRCSPTEYQAISQIYSESMGHEL